MVALVTIEEKLKSLMTVISATELFVARVNAWVSEFKISLQVKLSLQITNHLIPLSVIVSPMGERLRDVAVKHFGLQLHRFAIGDKF